AAPPAEPRDEDIACRRRGCKPRLHGHAADYARGGLVALDGGHHDRRHRAVVQRDEDGEVPVWKTTELHSGGTRARVPPETAAQARFGAAARYERLLDLVRRAAAGHGKRDEGEEGDAA